MEGPTGADNPVEQVSTTNKSWEEIRSDYQNSPYSNFAEAVFNRIGLWEVAPRVGVLEAEWNKHTDEQIRKTRKFPYNSHSESASIWYSNEADKIVARGKECPKTGKGILTRIYIGLDPRKSADAYMALVKQLENIGVLKDIDVSLYMEVLESRVVAGNAIVIYEPLSRPEVLNNILKAYREVSQAHPELFFLSPRQKATVARENVRSLKAIIDANMAFVEMAPEERDRSWDSDVIHPISQALQLISPPGTQSLTDSDWLQRLKANERGSLVIHKRSLSVPPLIQQGTSTVK